MNIALILAGGVGSRMNMADFPKQYIEVQGRPIISYCLRTFEQHPEIDAIMIVADEKWHPYVQEWLQKDGISKFKGFVQPGRTRQLSIYNGLKQMSVFAGSEDIVVIHDAARPLLPAELITSCITANAQADGVMPVLPAKDTFYESGDGSHITRLIKRSTLFAGQAPESFHFGSYYAAHQKLSDAELEKINGSSELAYLQGLNVVMIPGAEINFKITTQADLQMFETYLSGESAQRK